MKKQLTNFSIVICFLLCLLTPTVTIFLNNLNDLQLKHLELRGEKKSNMKTEKKKHKQVRACVCVCVCTSHMHRYHCSVSVRDRFYIFILIFQLKPTNLVLQRISKTCSSVEYLSTEFLMQISASAQCLLIFNPHKQADFQIFLCYLNTEGDTCTTPHNQFTVVAKSFCACE